MAKPNFDQFKLQILQYILNQFYKLFSNRYKHKLVTLIYPSIPSSNNKCNQTVNEGNVFDEQTACTSNDGTGRWNLLPQAGTKMAPASWAWSNECDFQWDHGSQLEKRHEAGGIRYLIAFKCVWLEWNEKKRNETIRRRRDLTLVDGSPCRCSFVPWELPITFRS